MPEREGELERKIKRAYVEDSVSERKARRRTRKRLGVSGTQGVLCAVALAGLLALRLVSSEGFERLQEAYNAMWSSPEALVLDAAADSVREAAAELFGRLGDAEA